MMMTTTSLPPPPPPPSSSPTSLNGTKMTTAAAAASDAVTATVVVETEKKNGHYGGDGQSNMRKDVVSNINKSSVLSSSSSSSNLHNVGHLLFQLVRWGIVHGGLTIIFILWMSTYIIQVVHDDYFVTIVERARRTDEDLYKEYTYYDRPCNVADLTATSPSEATDLIITPSSTTGTAVDKLMRHGALMIPSMLGDDMIHTLRRFVVMKNAAVKGTAAEFPVSQGTNRISYGIEATEDDAVIEALQTIYGHPQLLKILQQVLGDVDPSLTEITAITASYGCSHQGWHSDVKSDGNAIKFGRTYSHSYSLFIPLQDTTVKMGPTDLCAGTHYCSDPDIQKVCNDNKIGAHEVGGGSSTTRMMKNLNVTATTTTNDNNVWKAGDGFLLNQQVWHRGSAHRDADGPDRILFIVSFIGRPHQRDHVRQLSRGTYFHMKYNMWGHSFTDLKDPTKWMGWPWNILRCLHIWKPYDRNFGFDLFTSAAMRIANSQLGCQPDDLRRLMHVLDGLGLPSFLDGTIDYDHPEAWQLYFRETIPNYFHFFMKLNLAGLAVYVGTVLVIALWKWFCSRKSKASSTGSQQNNVAERRNTIEQDGIRPLVISHGLVLLLTGYVLYTIHSSPWAQDIASGKTLMRPFPNITDSADTIVRSTTNIYPWRSFERSNNDDMERALTTIPVRSDVLVGTRMNSRTIGSYGAWFDYHPGNTHFKSFLEQYGGRPYRRLLESEVTATTAVPIQRKIKIGNNNNDNKYLTPMLQSQIIHRAAIDLIERRDGRFLLQDYRTGDWLVMTSKAKDTYIKRMLIAGGGGTIIHSSSSSSMYGTLKQELDFLLDKYRLGFQFRDYGPLKRLSETYIYHLSDTIFAIPGSTRNQKRKKSPSNVTRTSRPVRNWPIVKSTTGLPNTRMKLGIRMDPERSFYLYQEVTYVSLEDDFSLDVTIIGLSDPRKRNTDDDDGDDDENDDSVDDGIAKYDVAVYGLYSYDYGTVLRGVPGVDLYTNPPLMEGDEVVGNYRDTGEYYRGIATRVYPYGDIHITYNSGEKEYFVPNTRYGLPIDDLRSSIAYIDTKEQSEDEND